MVSLGLPKGHGAQCRAFIGRGKPWGSERAQGRSGGDGGVRVIRTEVGDDRLD